MKSFILIISIFHLSFSFGQSDFDKRYSTDVCTCFEKKSSPKPDLDSFLVCIQQVLENDSVLAMQEYKRIYGDTLYKEDRHFGQEIAKRMKIQMVSECKPYFILFDSLRYKRLNTLNKDSLVIILNSLNNDTAKNITAKFYNKRAFILFELKKYDSSLSDIKNVLKMDSANIQALYFKGWIEEIKGNYDEAIDLYNKVAVLTNEDSYYIFLEIAKRKKKGN